MDGIWQLALDLLSEMAENTVHQSAFNSNATMSACWIGGIWQLSLRPPPRRPRTGAARHHHSQRYDERLLHGWRLAAERLCLRIPRGTVGAARRFAVQPDAAY